MMRIVNVLQFIKLSPVNVIRRRCYYISQNVVYNVSIIRNKQTTAEVK